MNRWSSLISFLIAAGLGAAVAFGQGASPRAGTVVVPGTNVEQPGDIGRRVHTNFLIFVPASKPGPSGPAGETPTSLGCVYQINGQSLSSGCLTSASNHPPTGGSGVIAVVDAYDYPTAADDFVTFSDQFGLPYGDECGASGTLPCFTKVYATDSAPKANSGWALEAALDIEWAHAMAPNAQIVLVEAASSFTSDLLDAVNVASNAVATCNGNCSSGGTGEVSMSWGGSETSGEVALDTYFTTPGVIYVAASGDTGGSVIWPSASPEVVSAGGTTIPRDSSGDFSGETAWTDSGGGPSAVESEPAYQDGITLIDQTGMRGTPDFSFDSDPASGVSVYDSTRYEGHSGWWIIGGTSTAAQALAGIINLVGTSTSNSSAELTTIYSNFTNASEFTDITSGQTSGCHGNGHHQSSTCFKAGPGWDFMTGVGTNLGKYGK
jgi:subtilase family serine protease